MKYELRNSIFEYWLFVYNIMFDNNKKENENEIIHSLK